MDKKIKILVVDGIYPPAYTGSGLRAHRTYKRLSQSYDVEFAVITTTRGGFKPGYDTYDGIPIYRTKANKSLISQVMQVYRLFKNYDLQKFDIVHGFGGSLVVIAAGLMAKYYSIIFIYEITVLAPERKKSFERVLKDTVNFFRFGYARKIVNRSVDMFISLNKSINKHYLRLGVPQDKIWNRPNPVDTKKYYLPGDCEKKYIRNKFNIPENAIVILIVGRFEPRKNQKFALEVIRVLPDNYYLLMVGPTDRYVAWYLDDINHELEKNGNHKNVKLFPEYRNDIENFFKTSDILWIPSQSEGTPNVMLEALCCGIPVVVNKALGLDEFIKEAENGYQVGLCVDNFKNATIEMKKTIHDYRCRNIIALTAQNKYSNELIDNEFVQKLFLLANNKRID